MPATLSLRAAQDVVAKMRDSTTLTALVPPGKIRLDAAAVPETLAALPAIAVRLGDETSTGAMTTQRVEQACAIEVRIVTAGASVDALLAAEAIRAAVYAVIMVLPALDGGAQIADAPETTREYDSAESNVQVTTLTFRARITHAWSDLTSL